MTKHSTILSGKKQVLAEMRNGLFCSECNRTQSEIKRTGVRFSEHLRQVSGKAVANPELLARKSAEYDNKLASQRQQCDALERSKAELQQAEHERREQESQRARQAYAPRMEAEQRNQEALQERAAQARRDYETMRATRQQQQETRFQQQLGVVN